MARWWCPAPVDGTDYAFLLDDDETPLPDPRSLWQPARRARAVAASTTHHAFGWTDGAWTGRALPGGVIYELHIGTFTAGGHVRRGHRQARPPGRPRRRPSSRCCRSTRSTAPRAGATTAWLWGAVHEPYGGPDAFKRFVDACHARGLGVLLDVVYNHLGPSGRVPRPVRAVLRRAQRLGPGAEPRRPGLRRGPPVRHRQRAAAGCATSTSTGCGSTPCTRWSTTARRTSSRSWRSRWTRCPRGRAAAVADRRVGPQRREAGHLARRRRLRAAGAVVRRPAPLPARRADRRDRRLLRGLRRAGRLEHDAAAGVLPRRHLVVVPRRSTTAARSTPAGPRPPVPRLPAEPRPDRQPGHGRPADRDRVAGTLLCARGDRALLAVHADAVHGRGVGG